MKTGTFITKQYEKEISRILQELEVAKTDILAEKEILNLQSQVKVHEHIVEGTFGVHLSCGGTVALFFVNNRSNWNTICRLEYNGAVQDYKFMPGLTSMHLSQLKKCHPKMAGQLLRQLAKKALLDNVEETTTKKWWEFWKK